MHISVTASASDVYTLLLNHLLSVSSNLSGHCEAKYKLKKKYNKRTVRLYYNQKHPLCS